MAKTLKIIVSIIAILIILVVLAAFAVAKIFNPNHYLPEIEQFVYKQTGRHLDIQGEMKWSFFPWVGIEIPHVILGNPAGFQEPIFAKIGNLQIKVKMLPLFSGKIVVDNIGVDSATINLILNKNHQANWQSWTPSPSSHHSNQRSTSSHPLPIRAISIREFTIKNSDLHFINQATNTIWNINHLNFSINHFDHNKTFPLKMSFDFNQNHSTSTFQYRLNADAKLNLITQRLTLPQFTINATIFRQDLPKIPLTAKGTLALALPQENLTIDKLALTLANMPLTGALHIKDFLHTPQLEFNLESGKTDIETFIKTLQNKDYLTGTLTLKTHLVAQGSNAHQIESSLSGNGNITIDNGTLKGVNIERLLQQAVSLVKKNQQISEQNNNETSFFKISANYSIENGLLKNNDLLLTGQAMNVQGAGTIDFVNNNVNYKLNAQYSSSGKNTQPDFSLPILITGNLYGPKIVPDFSAIAQKLMKKEIENFINDKPKNIGKVLQDIFRQP